jgi:hypothetical protein
VTYGNSWQEEEKRSCKHSSRDPERERQKPQVKLDRIATAKLIRKMDRNPQLSNIVMLSIAKFYGLKVEVNCPPENESSFNISLEMFGLALLRSLPHRRQTARISVVRI